MSKNYKYSLKKFKTITLEKLNEKSSFLKRIDKKYLLNGKEFSYVLEDLKKDFKVLEIKGKKIFSYDNIYMDTEDYLFYNQHQEGKKSRTKIRTRYYVDSDLAFFEFKQKEKGVTTKYRYDFPSTEHGFMTKGKKRFFQGLWQAFYNSTKAPVITPAIRTQYKRITLVSKCGKERLTIDFDIRITDLRDLKSSEVNLKNLVIIESKSLNKKCASCKIVQKHNLKKAKSCSKYSLGVIYSGLAKKYDVFKETIEEIKKIRLETINKTREVFGLKNLTKLNKKSRFIKKELKK